MKCAPQYSLQALDVEIKQLPPGAVPPPDAAARTARSLQRVVKRDRAELRAPAQALITSSDILRLVKLAQNEGTPQRPGPWEIFEGKIRAETLAVPLSPLACPRPIRPLRRRALLAESAKKRSGGEDAREDQFAEHRTIFCLAPSVCDPYRDSLPQTQVSQTRSSTYTQREGGRDIRRQRFNSGSEPCKYGFATTGHRSLLVDKRPRLSAAPCRPNAHAYCAPPMFHRSHQPSLLSLLLLLVLLLLLLLLSLLLLIILLS